MITLEKTLEILKKDHNFREIIFHNQYSLTWKEILAFQKSVLTVVLSTVQPFSLLKGQTFKKEYLEQAIQKGFTFLCQPS